MKKYYDTFRQSRDVIIGRLEPFLSYYDGLSPIADIGCGRGEFIELLKKAKIDYLAVDSDREMVDFCLKRGLTARREDLLEFLKKQGDLGGVFISQVIEHLDCEKAEEMIRLSFESLKPGGRIIIITPNPENISVMTKAFWLDPTHIRPYPLLFLGELLKEYGFRVVASGGAPGTFGNNKLFRTRRFLARMILPFVGMKPMWDYLHAAQDIYIVGEKPNDL